MVSIIKIVRKRKKRKKKRKQKRRMDPSRQVLTRMMIMV